MPELNIRKEMFFNQNVADTAVISQSLQMNQSYFFKSYIWYEVV